MTISAATEVVLRLATPVDAPAIAEVSLAAFKVTYHFPLAHTDDQVRRWIAEYLVPNREVWVATEPGGAVVGLMALSADQLDQLYLAPGWAKRGIGSRLVELAKERRPDGLDLFTFQVKANARRFYERQGFGQAWTGDGSDNDEGQPDVRFAWRPLTS